VQIGDELVHRSRIVAQRRGGDREAPLQRRHLPVKELAGAVDTGHEDEGRRHELPLW
jgi:hypothetical protein